MLSYVLRHHGVDVYQQQHVVVCVIACIAVCDDVVSCACVGMYIGSSIISKRW